MKSPEINHLLATLRERGVQIWLDGQDLRYRSPAGALTPELLLELSQQKLAIIDFLKNNQKTMADQASFHLRPRSSKLPLSFAQERLWFLDRFEPDSAVYNIPLGLRLKGPLDVIALRDSLGEILRRHEALRTHFEAVEDESCQVIEAVVPFDLPIVDLSELPDSKRDVEVKRLCAEEAQQPFNLARGPVLRAKLLRLGAEEHIFLLVMHHIASDAWSVEVLVGELKALYQAFCAGKPSLLPPLPIQYADFALWQRDWFQGALLDQQLDYWKRQLAGAPTVLELPTDHPRPATQSFRGAVVSCELPKTLLPALNELSRSAGVSLFMTLLAAFQTLLSRYTGQEDVVVGSVIAGRNQSEVENLIGFFVNTLVLRGDLSGNPTFRTLLNRTREVALGAYAHQELPFEKLVEVLQPERDTSRSPLFQVLFVVQNPSAKRMQLAGVEVTPLPINSGTAKFDLTIFARERESTIYITAEYNTDLFDSSTIERWLEHYRTLLEGVVADPEQRLSELPLLTEAERNQLLVEYNNTITNYPRERCVYELFEVQAERTPEAIAVVFENKQLTYRELNERANQLAHHLRKLGVGPDTLVGISVERSLEMVLGLLGILKAGGAYVPMDPEYPKERLALILEDAEITFVLTQHGLRSDLSQKKIRVIYLDGDWEWLAKESKEDIAIADLGKHLAYVLYTSGSTGKPKGVAMSHGPLCNLIVWQLQNSSASRGKTLQFASLNFDVSFQEIFSTLCGGGTLVIVSQARRQETAELLHCLNAESVERLFLPFVALQQLAEVAEGNGSAPVCLREVITAGEQLRISPQIAWLFGKLGNCRLCNHYGPTESHVVTSYTLSDQPKEWPALPPIGRPIANAKIYLLDHHLQPVPLGVVGEIYIGGEVLANGYLNRPELTTEKFIPNPFISEAGSRLYKTGDLARYLHDGNIEFLGRIDFQVKIRGFRIELGEIEAQLAAHPAVKEVVAVAREDASGGKQLVAYLTVKNGEPPKAAELRGLLQTKLPEYMVPSAFVILDQLPLTPSGKLDRKALPKPEFESADFEHKFVAPRNSIEQVLAGIFQETLKVSRVGVEDNFFDLGGHSLLATRVISRVRQIFALDLTLHSFFASPTVGGMATSVLKLSNTGCELEKRADLFLKISKLSDDEVNVLLNPLD
jgi:surfactin family lipopeptide synthetase A